MAIMHIRLKDRRSLFIGFPSGLKRFFWHNHLDIQSVRGKPLFSPEELHIEYVPNGEIRVSGFPPGQPPAIETILAQVFPEALSIEFLDETHERPFDTYTFAIDGRLYKSCFLSGGFTPSRRLSIGEL